MEEVKKEQLKNIAEKIELKTYSLEDRANKAD